MRLLCKTLRCPQRSTSITQGSNLKVCLLISNMCISPYTEMLTKLITQQGQLYYMWIIFVHYLFFDPFVDHFQNILDSPIKGSIYSHSFSSQILSSFGRICSAVIKLFTPSWGIISIFCPRCCLPPSASWPESREGAKGR